MAASDEGSSLSAGSGIGPTRSRGDSQAVTGEDEADTASHEGETRQVGPKEHYGPLTLARYVKHDGRALILYTRAGGDRA